MMILPCTHKELIASGIAIGVVATGGPIVVWKLVDATNRQLALLPVIDSCCTFSPPVANCTSDPKAYCNQIKSEWKSLDKEINHLFLASMVLMIVTLCSLGYLTYSSYKTGGRVYRLVQNCRLRAGYQAIAERVENPSP